MTKPSRYRLIIVVNTTRAVAPIEMIVRAILKMLGRRYGCPVTESRWERLDEEARQ